MFKGEFQHTIDQKGRLIIPAKFREGLGERFVATRGLENCLFLYPQPEWEQFEAKIQALPVSSRDARAVTRFFFAGAADLEFDAQGRILLPENLRQHAQLEKDVVVIGLPGRVEIWSRANWAAYQEQTDDEVAGIAEKLMGI